MRELKDARYLGLIPPIVCRRCNGRGTVNYSSGGAVYLNALPCEECDRCYNYSRRSV